MQSDSLSIDRQYTLLLVFAARFGSMVLREMCLFKRCRRRRSETIIYELR